MSIFQHILGHFWLLLEPILAQAYSLVPSIVAQIIVRLLTIWMGRLLSTWQAGGSNARGSNQEQEVRVHYQRQN